MDFCLIGVDEYVHIHSKHRGSTSLLLCIFISRRSIKARALARHYTRDIYTIKIYFTIFFIYRAGVCSTTQLNRMKGRVTRAGRIIASLLKWALFEMINFVYIRARVGSLLYDVYGERKRNVYEQKLFGS